MSDQIHFLTLRLGEDRDRPNFLRAMAATLPPDAGRYIDVLAGRLEREVQAKTKTLARCQEEMLSGHPRLTHFAEQTLWELTEPYADHPDFDKEWRP